MPVLTSQQRNTLEAAVKDARRKSETGARNALIALAVNHPEPFAHLDAIQRSLRNNLRSKARLLGDALQANGAQQIDHLSYELAYETWHKMLFAKFLEANHMLMHPDGVPVMLDDCDQLAPEEGFADKWDAAAQYASLMLPAIFRVDDPLMKVGYATNDRIKLESIIEGLENSIFTADDALGWVYQFWQSEAKAAINASGDKIDGEKLPAVTQLFTEPYMVHFLIDNTIGAWWVSRNPGVKPPVKFEYLRLLKDGTPAAGKFEGWPDTVAGAVSSPSGGGREGAVTSLDPCMGSGHFVAALFTVFAHLRMYEEGLSKEEATDKVIAENLHGLELDPRCTQIAAFNLALTAWKFCGHYKALPEMNLACSGIAPKGKVEDWIKLVSKEKDPAKKLRLENGMKMLYDHFQLAPELGSLLDPTTIKADMYTASFEELQPVLKTALESEADTEQLERGVMAAGIAKAGQLLAKKYILQITNVPYLGYGNMIRNGVISHFCEKNYPASKNDLATVFLERMLSANLQFGTSCVVIPQNWLFLTSYKKLRFQLLQSCKWQIIARLGPKGFQTPMWDFNVMLVALQNIKPTTGHIFFGMDVSQSIDANTKRADLLKNELLPVDQVGQISNPDHRIILEKGSAGLLLEHYGSAYIGQRTGDGPRFILSYWELENIMNGWVYFGGTVNVTQHYSGLSNILLWEDGKGKLAEYQKNLAETTYASGGWKQGWQAWSSKGIRISQMGKLSSSIHYKGHFDNNCSVFVLKKEEQLAAIWCFCSSSDYNTEVRKIDQKINVTNATLAKVPFDLEHWQKVAAENYPNGLPKPYSDDPTQWIFHGHPIKTDNPLQVALARILGYRWPAEYDTEMELADEARSLIAALKAFDHLSDEDGIFCVPSVNAELAGADRLREYLQQVFANEWNNQTMGQLLQEEGAKSANLEAWLRDEFFVQHCKLFQNRPFIWHIWDGRKDGFSVLVNYHKLTKDNLSKIIYTYLGDWIRMCEAKKKAGESGAEGLMSAAIKLKEKLETILEGEAPYDIFVRWKPLAQQPIGWEPDLNDGVRLNIRPLVEAGVLRSKFNIKWGIDRGKNPPGSPWGEVRDNDKHLNLEEKRKARNK